MIGLPGRSGESESDGGPAGEGFTVDGIDVFTVEAGEIVEIYAHWDTPKMAWELYVVSAADSIIR